MARHNPGGQNRDGGSKRSCGGALGIRITLLSVFLLWTVGETAGDTTLETDTESLAQFYFALGGPGWQRRDGWEILEEAREQFDDVFDTDGDEVLTLEELKRGLNVNYVGCRFPPCFPSLTVHNQLFRIPPPANSFALAEFGFFDNQVSALISNAVRQRTDPIRGQAKIDGRDASIDGMVLFKEFFSNFIRADPCLDRWHGISCTEQGRVIGISLPANHLSGTIPPDIGNLTRLQGLLIGGMGGGGIERNHIIGEIPDNIDQCYLLQTLHLDHNLLSGHIPAAVGRLSALSTLELSYNRFEGPLPDLSGLKELSALNVQHNLLNGSIATLQGLLKLERVDVSFNHFSGSLQQPLLGLPLLRSAYIHANPLADAPLPAAADPSFASFQARVSGMLLGQDKDALMDLYQSGGGEGWFIQSGWDQPGSDPCVSTWFGVFCDDQGRVTALHLAHNNMSGQLPISIGQLAQLKTLSLPGNSLRGTIPTQLADLRYLRTLHLADNHLTGPIPAPLGQLRELEEVDLARNYLFGPLPVPTGEQGLLRVSVVDLSHNRLQGPLPAAYGSLPALRRLDLSFNRLAGQLPPTLSSLVGLAELKLNGNVLSGHLPPEWASLPRLRVLDLSDNRLEGPLPREWGPGSGLRRLESVRLDQNRLSGELPGSLFSLPRLQTLGLAYNQLTGGIPPSIRMANASLGVLQLRGNQLSGPIPSSLAALPELRLLDISDNKFHGFLPDFFNTSARLRSLSAAQLLLGGNDLACPIPPFPNAASASCTTRNCALGWVSSGTKCLQCPPGYFRDALRDVCSRCQSTWIEAEHPSLGVVTDVACAVWASTLPQMYGVVGPDGSSDQAVKCMPCRLAQEMGLAVLADIDGAALDEQYRNERVYPTSGYTTMRFNGSSAYSDGSEYIGEWRDGAPHGRGTLATRNGMYVGHFALGKKVGKGVFSTRSGDELGGEWADGGRYHEDTGTNWGGVLNGKGYAKYRANAQVALRALSMGVVDIEQVGTAGGTYEGEWMDGEWHGFGAFSAANGDVYLGEYARGKRHGRGMMEYALGGFYRGSWRDGKQDGNGTWYYANGDIYEGGFVRGMRHGWGVQWYWDGRLYEGYWADGMQSGWGRETQQRTGDVLEGQFEGGMPNGHVIKHFGNGDAFHGYYVDGLRHGDGIMHYADAQGRDVGFTLKAGFMFGAPREVLTPTTIEDGLTITTPRDADNIPDDNLQYWGQRNTNFQVGDGFAGGGR